MSAKLYVVDASGVTRQAKKLYVVDSSGVTRSIKKEYVVDAGGTARLVFTSGDAFTITAGGVGSPQINSLGYVTGAFGAIAPSNVLGDGRIIRQVNVGNNTSVFIVTISGFSADPTAAYIQSLTINGQMWVGTSATYTFGNTNAQWQWSGAASMQVGALYPMTVVRND